MLQLCSISRDPEEQNQYFPSAYVAKRFVNCGFCECILVWLSITDRPSHLAWVFLESARFVANAKVYEKCGQKVMQEKISELLCSSSIKGRHIQPFAASLSSTYFPFSCLFTCCLLPLFNSGLLVCPEMSRQAEAADVQSDDASDNCEYSEMDDENCAQQHNLPSSVRSKWASFLDPDTHGSCCQLSLSFPSSRFWHFG